MKSNVDINNLLEKRIKYILEKETISDDEMKLLILYVKNRKRENDSFKTIIKGFIEFINKGVE